MPYCRACERPFQSVNALEQHRRMSSRHSGDSHRTEPNDSSVRVSQQTTGSSYNDATISRSHGLATSQESAATEYQGIPPSLVKPVYQVALKMRRDRPSVQDIVRISRTSLETSVVAALLSAAERLNSLQEGVEEAQLRAEKQRVRSQQAKVAESSFIKQFLTKGYLFITESEQHEQARVSGEHPLLTPDMLFISPVVICGKTCGWLEFKDYFGFPSNPFVSQKEKKQFNKYVKAFGSGAVVYEIGFQCGYPDIEGVETFRATEVLASIGAQQDLEQSLAGNSSY